MSQKTFTASAWYSGDDVYGLRIPREVRDVMFKKNWKTVQLKIGRQDAVINMRPSFWRSCHELRSPAIRKWLQARGLDDWEYSKPPRIRVKHLGGNKFQIVGRA